MPNPLYQSMAQGNQNLIQMFQEFMSNPVQFAAKCNCNIPTNVNLNDPNAIMQYLMNSGQMSQQAYNNAYQKAQNSTPLINMFSNMIGRRNF